MKEKIKNLKILEKLVRPEKAKMLKRVQHDKSAFTLAEVLITLGIIGVVAAMTIPSLMNKIQDKHLVTALKKAYSVLSQANTMVQIEHPSSEWNMTDNDFESTQKLFDLYKPYLKIAKDCGCGNNVTGCWSKEPTKALNGQRFAYAYNSAIGIDTCAVSMADGMNVTFDQWDGTNLSIGSADYGVLYFYVDVNGDKKPNMMGKDVFALVVLSDKGIVVPAGYETESPKCSVNNTSNLAGLDCAAKVLIEEKFDY